MCIIYSAHLSLSGWFKRRFLTPWHLGARVSLQSKGVTRKCVFFFFGVFVGICRFCRLQPGLQRPLHQLTCHQAQPAEPLLPEAKRGALSHSQGGNPRGSAPADAILSLRASSLSHWCWSASCLSLLWSPRLHSSLHSPAQPMTVLGAGLTVGRPPW